MENVKRLNTKLVQYTKVIEVIMDAVKQQTGREITLEQYIGYDPKTKFGSSKVTELRHTLRDVTTALSNLEVEYERIFKNTLYEYDLDISEEMFEIHKFSGIDPFKYGEEPTDRELFGAEIAHRCEVLARKIDADTNY